MSNVQELLESYNLKYKLVPISAEEKKDANVQVCPFCLDDKSHFFVGLTNGLFHCKKCFIKGNLFQLESKLKMNLSPNGKLFDKAKIIEAHQNLLEAPDMLRYLTEVRGFNKTSIDHFKLGMVYEMGKNWLVIPYFECGMVVDIKYRTLETKEFRKEVGGKPVLYNIDSLDVNKPLLVVEGEMDCIACWTKGIRNVVSVPNGASSVPYEYRDFMRKFPTIYVCFDSDEAGQYGAMSFASKIGYDKCKQVIIPMKDANDFFMGGNSVQEFFTYINNSKPFEITSVTDIKNFLAKEKLINDDEGENFLTEWNSFNQILRKFRRGELMVLSGISGVGKTTLALNYAVHLAKNKVPVLFWCLEMPIRDLLMKVVCSENKCKLEDVKDVEEAVQKLPLYFSTEYTDLSLQKVEKLVTDSISRYGIKVLVFDNLHFLERGDDANKRVSEATKMFKMLALKYKISIILVSHLRKRIGKTAESFDLDDLKGSSSIHQDSDFVLFLYRRKLANLTKEQIMQGSIIKNDILEPLTWIGFGKARMGSGGETYLWLDGEHHRFIEIDDTIKGRLGEFGDDKI